MDKLAAARGMFFPILVLLIDAKIAYLIKPHLKTLTIDDVKVIL